MKTSLFVRFTAKEKIDSCIDQAYRIISQGQLNRSQQILLKKMIKELRELDKLTAGLAEVPVWVAIVTRVALQAAFMRFAQVAFHLFYDNPQ